jgi:hypothetical protein
MLPPFLLLFFCFTFFILYNLTKLRISIQYLFRMELEAARQVLAGLTGDVGNLIRERDTQSLLLYVVREALAPVQSAQILAVHFDGS